MYFLNFEYIYTPVGFLKILHIVFGLLSLILISTTFVPGVAGEELLLVTVSICFVISTVYLMAYFRYRALINSKGNHQLEFLYHALAAFMLVLAGIDWVAWGSYPELCAENCPPTYIIVSAKIITFTNGTLYGIVAFLNTRTWKAIHPDETKELLASSSNNVSTNSC